MSPLSHVINVAKLLCYIRACQLTPLGQEQPFQNMAPPAVAPASRTSGIDDNHLPSRTASQTVLLTGVFPTTPPNLQGQWPHKNAKRCRPRPASRHFVLASTKSRQNAAI